MPQLLVCWPASNVPHLLPALYEEAVLSKACSINEEGDAVAARNL